MRYTTIIDIAEIPTIYRNINARLLYVHMALKCGYHDNDRDILDTSIRNLAVSAGLTFSACRHALKVLEAAQLIKREGDAWIVRKWMPAQTISPRPKKTAQDPDRAAEERKQREREERKTDRERQRAQELAAQGKTQFMSYYEGLQARAAAGDQEAALLVKKHAETYAAHVAEMKKRKRN